MDDNVLDNLKREQVIYASASTYSANLLYRQNLRITLNVGGSKSRFVGDPANPLYPDIVVWQPGNTLSQLKDTAYIIEKIETAQSLEQNWRIWKQFASPQITFNLIVPDECVPDAQEKLEILNIRALTKLQSYRIEGNNVHFTLTIT